MKQWGNIFKKKGKVFLEAQKDMPRKEFKNFKIYDIWVSFNRRHYCLLAELRK